MREVVVEAPADQIEQFLAGNRWPACRSVEVRVPSQPGDAEADAAFASAMVAVLREAADVWPDGTVFVVDFDGEYFQGLYYPTTWLLELGRPKLPQYRAAVKAGWISPADVDVEFEDHETSSQWEHNPVREVDVTEVSLVEVAELLGRDARLYLGFEPADGYTVSVFYVDSSGGGGEEEDESPRQAVAA
jgi:hypothetical protein